MERCHTPGIARTPADEPAPVKISSIAFISLRGAHRRHLEGFCLHAIQYRLLLCVGGVEIILDTAFVQCTALVLRAVGFLEGYDLPLGGSLLVLAKVPLQLRSCASQPSGVISWDAKGHKLPYLRGALFRRFCQLLVIRRNSPPPGETTALIAGPKPGNGVEPPSVSFRPSLRILLRAPRGRSKVLPRHSNADFGSFQHRWLVCIAQPTGQR